jgi:NADPH-dependent curcumin reductase
MQNKQIRLAARPVGLPNASNWETHIEELPPLSTDDVLVKNQYISLDPAMRGWMNLGKSYIRPVEIGEVMRAGAAGVVVASENPKYKVGDFVSGSAGVQEYYIASQGKGLVKIDTRLAPVSSWLAALGMTGMTAYFGLLDVGLPKAGETVVVSGGAGAVGSIVGQIAKIKGCRVVGIAGGQDKVEFMLDQLGYDEAIDYKNGNLRADLKKACPEGIDVYFDNVGGETLDICLSLLKLNARIPICGAISQYNSTEGVTGPKNYLSLLVNRARMEGFVVFDYASRYKEAAMEIGTWMREGKLKSVEHIVEGSVEDFPESMLLLFQGDKIGKLLLKIA